MFDFKISDSGELISSDINNNLDTAKGDDLVRQLALCRIKSVTGDWFNEYNLGANLEDFLGDVNNQNTLKEIVERIEDSLADIVPRDSVFIIPRVNKEVFEFAVFIRTYSEKPIVINVTLDIVAGVEVEYDINT